METVCKDGVPASAPKQLNVYEQTLVRLEKIFNAFDNVYVSFSGGKDSSALLYMCIESVRKYCPGRKLGDIGCLSGVRAFQGAYLHVDAPALLAPLG